MIDALTKAIQQSFDPAFRRVFLLSLLLSIITFALVWLLSWLLMSWLGGMLSDWLAGADIWEWLKAPLVMLAGAGGVVVVLVASFLLFPAIMLVVMSFLLEPIARAVEERHYPGLAAAREQPVGEAVMGGLGFTLVSVGLNLLVLIFFWWVYLIPIANLFLFYGLNGYLLGREYFELVGQRRLPLKEAKDLRRSSRGRVFLSGVVIAFLLTIPLVNLLTPMVATAFMLHVFEGMRTRVQA